MQRSASLPRLRRRRSLGTSGALLTIWATVGRPGHTSGPAMARVLDAVLGLVGFTQTGIASADSAGTARLGLAGEAVVPASIAYAAVSGSPWPRRRFAVASGSRWLSLRC